MADLHGHDVRVRPWHAVAALEDLVITSWAVPLEAVAAVLPDGVGPQRFEVAGRSVALVSSVAFVVRDFRFRAAPMVKLTAAQVDHRTYVRRGDEAGVWSLGTSMASPLGHVARLAWAMPWTHEPVTVATTWHDGACRAASVRVGADGASTRIEAVAAPAPGGDAVPGALRSPAVTDPLVGWYRRRRGGVGRYTVWHPALARRVQDLVVRVARVRPFEALGLVTPGQAPAGAVIVRSTPFHVHTPPRRCT